MKYIRNKIKQLIRIIFTIKYLGPWRNSIINKCRREQKNKKFTSSNFTDISFINTQKILTDMEKSGYSIAGKLPENQVKNIMDTHQVHENYHNPHLTSKLINDILHSPHIYNPVKQYLGVEPILYRSSFWTRKDTSIQSAQECQRPFHFDVGDYKSITLFLYLSDVDLHSSPHIVIKDTHKIKCYQRIFKRFLPADKAKSNFKEKITPLCAEAGSVIFEDLSCYHKRPFGNKKRILLTATYHINREVSPRYDKFKASFYKKVLKLS